MALGRRVFWLVVVCVLLVAAFAGGWAVGRLGLGSRVDPASLTERERQFAARMRGVTLIGSFTISGEDRSRRPDRYDIASVEKVDDDVWRFNARMRHGDVDVTLPIAVPMRWIGDTPVVMLTDSTIPGLGTFSARVIFDGDRYAGTWDHGDVGGHLFGRIVKRAGSEAR